MLHFLFRHIIQVRLDIFKINDIGLQLANLSMSRMVKSVTAKYQAITCGITGSLSQSLGQRTTIPAADIPTEKFPLHP